MPAGFVANLKSATICGADAVYSGAPDWSLHTKTDFTLKQIRESIEYAHANDTRVTGMRTCFLTTWMFPSLKNM